MFYVSQDVQTLKLGVQNEGEYQSTLSIIETCV
jgi:hypothetical protein